jgi:hypothetical protein
VFVIALPVDSNANSQKYRFLFVQPQSTSLNLTDIQALTRDSVNLGSFAGLTNEIVFFGKIIVRFVGGNWVLTSVELLTGTKLSQSALPSGSFLSSVATDTTMSGNGTTANPLSVSVANLGPAIEALANKATIVAGDRFLASDSEATNAAKEVLASSINSFVRTGLSTARSSTEVGYTLSAAVTSTTPGTSPTNVNGASITIGAGTWRLYYSVTAAYQTGNAIGDYGNTSVFITDGSDVAVSGTPRMVFTKALATGGQIVRTCLSAEAPDDIVISGNTTYKLRCIREDGQGTGAGSVDALTYGGGYIKATRIR